MRMMFLAALLATPLSSMASPLDETSTDESSAVEIAQSESSATDASLFPPTTVVYAEIADPVKLISTIFDHPLREKIESLPVYQMAIQTPGYQQFLMGRTMVEGQLNMPWREALETFLAHGVAFGIDSATKGAAVIVHGKDAESMKLFQDQWLALAMLGSNRDKIKRGEYRGVGAYRIDQVRVVVHEDRMLVTNNPDLGKGIIDRLIDGGNSLDESPRFHDALSSRDPLAAGWGFVDLEAIRDAKMAQSVFESQINNPVGELLLGGIQSTVQDSPFASASLAADARHFGLKLGTPFQGDWIPEEREYFFGPMGNGRGPSVPEVEETLFTLSLYRDFSEMWLRAGDLFGADINDGFAQADANLSTLFAGRDFGEDILGSFQPEVGIVATRQDLDQVLPRPTIKLPAFAAVFDLKDPETMTRELRRIFQSLVGFLNIVGAMNGQKQLELDMEKVGEAQLITSSYVPEDDDRESTDANIVYNFSPSVGFSGERFVVSSSKELAKQLTLAKKSNLSTIQDNTRATLQAGVLRTVLADNREQLIAQNMLEDGNTREEAEAIIDLVLAVVDYFQDVSIRLGSDGDQLEAELKVQVRQ